MKSRTIGVPTSNKVQLKNNPSRGLFKAILAYKMEWKGKHLVLVDRFFLESEYSIALDYPALTPGFELITLMIALGVYLWINRRRR